MKALQGGQAVALDPVHLRGPVVQFALQVVGAVVQGGQPGPGEVDRMDGGKLFDEALAHPNHRVVGRTGGWLHFVHVAGDVFHLKNGRPRTSPVGSSHSAAGTRTGVPARARRMANWRARS